jgi:hypothetical protein
MIVPNQRNIKVHFAGAEVMTQFYALEALGIKYNLYTAFPFLERTVLKTKKSPIIPCHLKNNEGQIPNYIASKSKHCIQDSGLFTLMFGSHKGQKDEKLMNAWYDGLVQFTLDNNNGATCVEVDCQKILGVEKAWEYRERFRNDIPNRIINVFHKEDGQKGLDRLIEFSDYIAISVPELRFLGQKNSVVQIANYIKNKKPNIDIHLLGCTELKLLKELSFCSSADSTSYKSGIRYGFIKQKHVKNIKTEEVKKIASEEYYKLINKYSNEQNTNTILLHTYYLNQQYNLYAGPQD